MRRSPEAERHGALTPEGQIEQVGDLTRGVVRRLGRERIGFLFLVGAIACFLGAIALAAR